MHWLVLSLASAFLGAVAAATLTKGARSGATDLTNALWYRFWTAITLLPWFLYQGATITGRGFWISLAVVAPLVVWSTQYKASAHRQGDLSLVSPLLSTLPAIQVVTAFLLLGERVSAVGLAGILVMVVGLYLLQASQLREGVLAPLRALGKEPAVRPTLLLALLASLTDPLGKRGILESDPLTWVFSVYLCTTVLALALSWLRGRGEGPSFRGLLAPGWGWIALAGASTATGTLIAGHAYLLAPVSYVTAVRSLSVLFSILLGALWLSEHRWRERIPGAVVILLGVLLLSAG